MGRCGCEGTTCGCRVTGTGAAVVTGSGTAATPYNVNVVLSMLALSTGSVGLQLLGSGSQADPWILTADFQGSLNDLLDVDTSGGTDGYVLAQMSDGSFALVPPATATPGAIATDTSLDGDGSSGDILKVRLAPNPGLIVDTNGLALDPYIVTSEATLDAEWGSLPPGSLVATADGSGVWVKTSSGWIQTYEDDPIVGVTVGNFTAATGWEVSAFSAKRRSGIVTMRLAFKTLVSRVTAIGNGNIGNIQVGTIVQSKFRPLMETPLRVLGAGDDSGFYLTVSGGVYMNNLSTADYTLPAGYTWSVGGTFAGA
jgi:hypothetical protein